MADGVDDSLVAQFVAITGVTKENAAAMLSSCSLNLELAVSMYLDSSSNGSIDIQEENSNDTQDKSVRAPIPQKHEQLVEEDTGSYGFLNNRNRRRKANSVFDSFRDFQSEAWEQENGLSTSRQRRGLGQLFRPPFDLIQKGTFQMVKDKGSDENKWLMVNIQNAQEFSCQVLNRDVWNDFIVKELVRKHFLLWQVYADAEEGKRYTRYYPITSWPYIAVLDPRTGEKFVEWHTANAESVKSLLRDFLKDHPSPGSMFQPDMPPLKKRRVADITDLSEEKQLEAAMAASLQIKSIEEITLVDSSDSDTQEYISDSDADVDEVDSAENNKTSSEVKDGHKSPAQVIHSGPENSSDANPSLLDKLCVVSQYCQSSSAAMEMCSNPALKNHLQQSWKNFCGSVSDPTFHLLLRLPDGKRLPLDLPNSSQLMAITLFVEEQGYLRSTHELVTHFPLQSLSNLPANQTLQVTGLNPRETIYVQEL